MSSPLPHRREPRSLVLLALLGAWLALASACGTYRDSKPVTVTPTFSFIRQGVLSTCVQCHSESSQQGGFALESFADVRSLVSPGDPSGSEFLQTISDARMPKGGPALPPSYVNAVSQWISQGAKDN